jgi:4-hydroxy-tetrahydrodipicolinate reductase
MRLERYIGDDKRRTDMKVVQMGLGPVGIAIAQLAASRPSLEFAGAFDPRPDLAGRDLGEIIGPGARGRRVSRSLEELLGAVRPDVVFHATSSFLADVSGQLEAALDSGASVVSTCEELAYPFHRHPELARDLDAHALARRTVLLGTGVNPGFVMDKLVLTLLGACRTVEHVHVERVVDASKRREPLQRKIGAGISPEEFEARARSGRFGHIGLPESAHMIADVLGLGPERTLDESLTPAIAAREVTTPYLTVPSGRVAGIVQSVRVTAAGKERVRLDLRMAVDARDAFDAITIEGTPGLRMRIDQGIHGDVGTAAVVVNAAGGVRGLAPGLRTMGDVPLRGFDLVDSINAHR